MGCRLAGSPSMHRNMLCRLQGRRWIGFWIIWSGVSRFGCYYLVRGYIVELFETFGMKGLVLI